MFKPEGASVRKDVAPAQAGGGGREPRRHVCVASRGVLGTCRQGEGQGRVGFSQEVDFLL